MPLLQAGTILDVRSARHLRLSPADVRLLGRIHALPLRGALNYKVPKSIPLHHAVFIEPLACSIHAVERGDIEYQDTVVIAGCGPLGPRDGRCSQDEGALPLSSPST